MKILGILLIILSISLIALSFGHEYVEDLVTASTLTVQQEKFEVTPNSKVVINYVWEPTFTNDFNIHLKGPGVDTYSPTVYLMGHDIYSGTFTITAPSSEGSYSYKLTPYMYPEGHLPTKFISDVKTVVITVVEPQPVTYTLTVNAIDSNSNPLSNVEISINTGIIGTTSSAGVVTKTDLSGSYTVTGTKEGYNFDKASVSMTEDRTITLQLHLIVMVTRKPTVEPTPDATVEPTEGVAETPTPDVYIPTPISTPVTYTFTIETLDNNDPQNPISDVKVMINGNAYYTNSIGKISHTASPGDTLNVVITKEGYNTFEKTYTVTSNTLVKVTLPSSGGDFFLDLNLKEANPFYDNEGLFGVMPVWVAIVSLLLFIAGVVIVLKEEQE